MTDVDPSQADAPPQFAAMWRTCDRVPGWLTREQAYDLWSAARELPKDAIAIEIGSHQGRSTVALGEGARAAGATVVAIDPFLEGRLLGGQGTRALFEQHMSEADLDGIVHLEADYSMNVLARWDRQVGLLYIDGKHDYLSCSNDVDWVVHMPAEARVYIHDAFSSVGVTACLVAEMLRPNPRLRYRGRSGSLAAFVTGRPTGGERLAFARELAWFSRNLIIKILLRLRLRRATKVFGHHSPYDPY